MLAFENIDRTGLSKAVEERRGQIIALIRSHGFMTVDSLVSHFGVTPQTIRRDINELDGEGLLRRFHGGAGLPYSVENVGYPTRKILHLDAKRRIARQVAAAIPDGASLFINIGTTTEEIARALLHHKRLRIITNNIHVASVLMQSEDSEIIITGGSVRKLDGGIVGEATLDLINQFRVDYSIIGISGIDLDGTLLDYDYREVRVAQAIIRNARRVFLAADHSKFGRPALVRLGSLADVSTLFTDLPPPEPIHAFLLAHKVELSIAPPPKSDGIAQTEK